MSIRISHLGLLKMDVLMSSADFNEGAVSSGMILAVVKEEWTSRTTQIFCRQRHRTSAKNTRPGAELDIDVD